MAKVSAIIPTRGRPVLVARAVSSALSQTVKDIEVIVVVDGLDSSTTSTLARIMDSRLRVVELPDSVGGAEARNVGVRVANSDWIAFLDDDDTWLPKKIERQLEAALRSSFQFPIVCSQFFAESPKGTFVWPRRGPAPNEPICEYLFSRRELKRGEGWLLTTVIFSPRDLLLRVPFTKGLKRHQDTDWYLRVANNAGVGFEYVPEPLAIYDILPQRSAITRNQNVEYTLGWLKASKALLTHRAYAGFIATQLGPEAVIQGDWRWALPLLFEMILHGRPRLIDLILYLGHWLRPSALRKNLLRQL